MNILIEENLDKLKALCEKHEINMMHVFGSVCNDNFHEESDIDILISFKEISIDRYTDHYFELHEALESIFKRKVDLITENSLSNPYFIKSIEASKELLYAA